jgi:hypothetical protein
MNIQNYLLVCLLLALPFATLCAQQLGGKVIESGTGKPIAYANIGIFGKSRGTVSDEQGYFRLNIAGMADNDTLRFSMIGYERLDYRLGVARTRCASGCTIELVSKSYGLSEVVISPKKEMKTKIVGNDIESEKIIAGMSDSTLGHEFGTMIAIKRKPALIEEITMHIAKCSHDTVFLRLNIHSSKNKKPDENLLKTPIYVQFTKEEAKQPIRIDMSPYNIKIQDDFLVSFEVVRELGQGELYLTAGLFNDKAFFRETSQAEWRILGPLGIGIAAKILQEK